MAPKVLYAVADGSEDMETVIPVDVLRRAGVKVTLASVAPQKTVTLAHGTKLTADALISDVAGEEFDLIAMPGGLPGADNLVASAPLVSALKAQASSGKLVGAICASPAKVLLPIGLLEGKKATAYPGFSDQLPDQSATSQRVVVDGNIVTSRGPGTALEWSLELAALLVGKEKADQVAKGLLVA